MSTESIFFAAVGVFALMLIGLILTAREFRKFSDDSSQGEPRTGHR